MYKYASLLDYVRAIKHEDPKGFDERHKGYGIDREGLLKGLRAGASTRPTYTERLQYHKQAPYIADVLSSGKDGSNVRVQTVDGKRTARGVKKQAELEDAFIVGFLKAAAMAPPSPGLTSGAAPNQYPPANTAGIPGGAAGGVPNPSAQPGAPLAGATGTQPTAQSPQFVQMMQQLQQAPKRPAPTAPVPTNHQLAIGIQPPMPSQTPNLPTQPPPMAA